MKRAEAARPLPAAVYQACCHGRKWTSASSARSKKSKWVASEDLWREPEPQLGDDPARDSLRQNRHHRSGSVPQTAERRSGQAQAGREVHACRVHHESRCCRSGADAALQQLAVRRRSS
ncbi:hypothetical protein M8494_26990 [Serratia ureilytica]